MKARGHEGAQQALAQAVADVAVAGEQLIAQRIELLRWEIQHDLRRVTVSVVLAFAVLFAGTGAVGVSAAGLFGLVQRWLPNWLAYFAVGVFLGIVAIVLGQQARKSLSTHALASLAARSGADAIQEQAKQANDNPSHELSKRHGGGARALGSGGGAKPGGAAAGTART